VSGRLAAWPGEASSVIDHGSTTAASTSTHEATTHSSLPTLSLQYVAGAARGGGGGSRPGGDRIELKLPLLPPASHVNAAN